MSADGEDIEGDYKFTDEFPMAKGFEENAEFFTLTYETPVALNHNSAFARFAPLLWMRAAAKGGGSTFVLKAIERTIKNCSAVFT